MSKVGYGGLFDVIADLASRLVEAQAKAAEAERTIAGMETVTRPVDMAPGPALREAWPEMVRAARLTAQAGETRKRAIPTPADRRR